MGRILAAGVLLSCFSACASKPELVRFGAPAAPALLIESTAVLDVQRGLRTLDQDVLVKGERIVAIGPTGSFEVPAGTQRLSGSGATVLPGLVDVHVHVGGLWGVPWDFEIPDAERNLRMHLYAGVTTVLDAGGRYDEVFDLRRRVAAGEIPGPRIFSCGPIVTAADSHPLPLFRRALPWGIQWYLLPRLVFEVSTPGEARVAAERIASFDADCLKTVADRLPKEAPRIGKPLLAAVVAAASDAGLRTFVHIGKTVDAVDAAEAGAAAWMHGVYRERIPDESIPRLAAFGIPMVPTVVVFDQLSRLGSGSRESTALESEMVSADRLDRFASAATGSYGTALVAETQQLAQWRGDWLDNIARLQAAGVRLLAGSDTNPGVIPGAGLHRELAFFAGAGLSNAEVLRAATLDAARFLDAKESPSFGAVAVGLRADLLVVEGNPLEGLDALSRIRHLVAAGRVIERRSLRAAER